MSANCPPKSSPLPSEPEDEIHESSKSSKLSRRTSGRTKEVRFDDHRENDDDNEIFVIAMELERSKNKKRHVSVSKDGKRKKSEHETHRTVWSSSTEFMLTCVGYCVGLGNVWRFPYLCYKNGGGAFIIPYTIMMMIIGAPLLFMEYSIGQYFGVGSLSIFKKMCPLLQGIGMGHTVLNVLVCTYYNLIISLALYYMYASLASSLPWSNCDNQWNTLHCYSEFMDPRDKHITNTSTITYQPTTETQSTTSTTTPETSTTMTSRTSPAEEYFRLAVLRETDEINIQNLGSIQWHLCLSSFVSWFCITMFVCRGIKSTGKVAYFTAIFPYIMLTILVARGSSLPGAYKGIVYFITPYWDKLLSPDVWFQAATQLFYSTSLAWGGMITMASYNTFHHDCYRDAIVINFISFFTSLYAGVAVFAVIGHMANVQNISVEDVIQSGPGLAFIVYPGALSKMALAPIWTILFFFMIFLLGVGSQMVLIETVVTGFVDEFPRFGLNAKIRFLTTAVLCLVFFVAGIPMTTQGGMYVLQLMDHYSAGLSVLVIAIFECAAVNWFYGNKKISENVKIMLGRPIRLYWKVCWIFLSPFMILCMAAFSFVKYRPAEYKGILYPFWADVIGWMLCLASIIPIFVVAVVVFCRSEGPTMRKKFLQTIQPLDESGDINNDEIRELPSTSSHLPVASPGTITDIRRSLIKINSAPSEEEGSNVHCCHAHHHRRHQFLRIRRESLLNELTDAIPDKIDTDDNNDGDAVVTSANMIKNGGDKADECSINN